MLREEIEENFKKALKEGNKEELSALRMLKTEIVNRQKEKRYKLSKENPELPPQELEEKSSLDDEEIKEAVFSLVKKSKQAIEDFEKGERKDLAEKERKEVEVLEKYLPEQLSEEEIKKEAQEAIKDTGAEGMRDMGKVMSELMPKLKGKAEGSKVSRIVKNLLS
ncbi:MAG: GatB/YqeY domain-containing protein [Candidatus Nealsonbacteria bacterium]|nr:GatB/YqeY domain-containing protein [Candidatus Nealsonbacteria bacterium]